MIPVGIDCGKNRVHAYINDDYAKGFEVKSGTPRDVSLCTMRAGLSAWLMEMSESMEGHLHLYVEEAVLAGRMNIRATIGIAETVGMVLSMGFPSTLVPVSTWKKSVVGKGNATKEDVERWYRDQGGTLRGQDFYDSAVICEYGRKDLEVSQRLRGGLLSAEGPAPVPEHGQALANLARKGKLPG